MANRNWASAGKVYSMHVQPVKLDCNFVVDSTNANGLGISSLKGPGIANVFMHTSQTPGTGNYSVVNPNPAAGFIMVQLQDNYNRYFGGTFGFLSPASGNNVNIDASDAAMTVGQLYTITTLGTSTAADWVAVGLPIGVTAAVGASFIAIATGAGTGTGKVQVPKTSGSGISRIEVAGDPNTTIAPAQSQVLQGTGGLIFMQCLGGTFTAGAYTPVGTVAAPAFTGSALGTHTHTVVPTGTNDGSTPPLFTGATDTTSATSAGTPAGTNSAPAFTGSAASLTGTTSFTPTAPANGTTIGLAFYLSNSSILIQGE